MFICNKSEKCISCHDYFQQLRPLVTEVLVSKHFRRDAPGFDVNLVLACENAYFRKLHKFEETISGNHIFRAMKGKVHIVYAIDKEHRLIFLRAFNNFEPYKKFLENRKKIIEMIESVSEHIKI